MNETASLLAVVDQHVQDGDEAAITGWAIGLPADRVPAILYAVMERRKVLDRLEDVLEAKAIADGLKSWTAPDGREFTFGAARKRLVAAPRRLRDALLDAIMARVGPDVYAAQNRGEPGDHPHLRAMRAAFRENDPTVLLTALDSFLSIDPTYAAAAEDFVTWSESGPAHLREKYQP